VPRRLEEAHLDTWRQMPSSPGVAAVTFLVV
jgi:hypothetical protein